MFIALIIALSAAAIVWESVNALINPRELRNLGWVFAAAVVGMVGNELVAIYRIRVGRKIGSAALIAEGQHARSDGFISAAVLLAVIGVWLGFPEADAIVGLLIALAVVWILISTSRLVLRRLMDGVDEGTCESIETVASGVTGVEAVGAVKARWSGHRLEAQIDLGVNGDLTVAQGHRVAEEVHHELLHGIPHLDHVAVHINPSYDGAIPADAHELTGHHASVEARRDYLLAKGEST